MNQDQLCKTVHQYNKEPVSDADMSRLLEIADDYCKVKNYVYTRFGGVFGLPKIYPGYTVQNEMTGSGLRDTMGLPSVYYYLAIFDAVADIKSQWTATKSRILKLVSKNQGFSPEEKHYLRFVLKVVNVLAAILNQKPIEKLPADMQEQYERLAAEVDVLKLHQYLRRQVRKNHKRPHADRADGFSISERGYRYGDHGIYITVKEKRKRIYIPLTDKNQYKSQLYFKLYPEEHRIEIKVPLKVKVKDYQDYIDEIGLAFGMNVMLTTDKGNIWGEDLGKYQMNYGEWIREKTRSYNRSKSDNPGRKKYLAQKRRFEEQMHSYINQQLNLFLKTEKPGIVYIARLPKSSAAGINPKINNCVSLWQRGYIRRRLLQKCREQSVKVLEVYGKGISCQCSSCGAQGKKDHGKFICDNCGYNIEEKTNTARNIKKRGQEGQNFNGS